VPPVPLDIAPDNLPTSEEPESFLPHLISKPSNLGVSLPSSSDAHPFEERMQAVFIAGRQSMDDLTIEPPPAHAPVTPLVPAFPNIPPSPRIYHADPYREPIE
ncbi:MAG: hypothetical protein WAV98_03755, partial [Minisyncoccia bacterium]